MQIIPMSRPLNTTDRSALERFSALAGANPFLCLNSRVMLMLTPGQSTGELLQEARRLMQANLTGAGGIFIHRLPDGRRLVRTVRDLCILQSRPEETNTSLLRRGREACRQGGMLALVIPGGEVGAGCDLSAA